MRQLVRNEAPKSDTRLVPLWGRFVLEWGVYRYEAERVLALDKPRPIWTDRWLANYSSIGLESLAWKSTSFVKAK